MRHKPIVIVLITVTAMWLAWQKLLPIEQQTHETSTPRVTSSTSLTVDKEPVLSLSDASTSLAKPSIHQCTNELAQYENQRLRYFTTLNYQALLRQGYSLDQVTLAIAHFLGPSHATTWRYQQLKANTQMAQRIATASQQFSENTATELLVQPHSPQPWLLEKLAHPSFSLAPGQQLYVDDIAWLISNIDILDAQIVTVIKHFDDINLVVSQDYADALRLIDLAARAGRTEVVKALLNKGAALSDDNYLPSTLEWAIWGLSNAPQSRWPDYVEVIELLTSQGARAAFIYNEKGDIIEAQGRRFKLTAERIQQIYTHHQLDFDSLWQRDALHLDLAQPLIQQLQQRADQQLVISQQLKNRLSQCPSLLREFRTDWQPLGLAHALAQVSYEGDVDLAALNARSVQLYECYTRNQARNAERTVHHSQAAKAYLKVLRREGLEAALASLYQQPLTEALRRDLFYASLSRVGAQSFTRLQSSLLGQSQLDYVRLPAGLTLPQLREYLPRFDSHGHSLLYYAISHYDTELLTQLVAAGVPYHQGITAMDPLALSLQGIELFAGQAPSLQVLDEVMTYQPSLTPWHRSMLALIARKNPALYQQLHTRHPQLRHQDAPLPEYDCSSQF